MIALALGSAPLAATAAQPGAEPVLEEITVTARKRQESVLEVPVSVSAFDSEAIAQRGINDIRDLAAFTPGLNFKESVSNSSSGRQSGSVTIRGMSPANSNARDQTGSVFVDGIFVSTGIGSINTLDVERVEVLRGPQSTYFGRSTFAGAVNFVTRTPGDRLNGTIEADASTRDSYRLAFGVEGPLAGDWLKGRVTGLSNRKGAHYRAADGGGLGEETTNSVTGTLLLTPVEALSIRLRGHYQQDEDGPTASAYLRGTEFGGLCPDQQFEGRRPDGTPTTFTVRIPYFCGSIPSLGDLPASVVSSNTSIKPSVLERIGKPDYLLQVGPGNLLNSPVAARVPSLDRVGFKRTTNSRAARRSPRISPTTQTTPSCSATWIVRISRTPSRSSRPPSAIGRWKCGRRLRRTPGCGGWWVPTTSMSRPSSSSTGTRSRRLSGSHSRRTAF
jgi:hypothetical protein